MQTPSAGVELELWVVDRSGRLSDGAAITDAHERIEGEFIGPLVEIQTEPHTDTNDLRRDLQAVLGTAIRAASAEGLRLVPLGTPLTLSDASANCVRGHLFEMIYGDGIESAKNCAGTHVHFEQSEVTRQLNLLTALDPALALLSSSPYYDGERGQQSCRAKAYRTGCGSEFREFCELWSYTDSREAWRDRVDEAYEKFLRLAGERGIPRETVERFFKPENTVLNPVRLRESQPTVEWRAPDSALPSQILRLVRDVSRLIAQTEEKPVTVGSPRVGAERIQVPPFPELRALSREAIRDGLDSPAVRSYLETMGFDHSEYEPRSPEVAGRATMSKAKARRVRLRHADRLRDDVAALTDRTVLPAASSAL